MSARARELWHFFVHLRPHYQLLVLPGGFMLGALYGEIADTRVLIELFLVVHLLLNGGVTAFNSYYDKDEGPIGGLERPPPMTPWMLPASIALQLVGLVLSWRQTPIFWGLYLSTMVLSVLYSAPRWRWKGRPLLSLVAVGVGTGTNTFLMGYLAASQRALTPVVLVAAGGVAALLLSLYPVSQIFQVDEDTRRGDRTFTSAFGLNGVRRFFVVAQLIGLGLVTSTLFTVRPQLALVFFGVGLAGGVRAYLLLRGLSGRADEYKSVMRLKYGASLGFVAFLGASLFWVAWSARS